MPAQILEQTAVATAERRQAVAFARYLLLAFAGAFLCCAVTLMLAGSRWYMAHADNPGLRLAAYSQWMGRQDCVVLLYGDSSALTGLDPAIIEARTGLKTCNVAEGTVIQEVTGSDAPLRAYLRKNKAPRYLVGMWTSSMFHPDQPQFQKYREEGFAYSLNYLSPARILLTFAAHPTWFLRFAGDTYDGLVGKVVKVLRNQGQVDVRSERISKYGQWVFPLPPETKCVRAGYAPSVSKRWSGSADRFRQKYSSGETKVIIDIAPVPDCDDLFDVYDRNDAGMHDNKFERVPLRYFNQGDVHFSPEGSLYVSEQAARQILSTQPADSRHAMSR